jgi:excisionase family DNA binding protein
MGLSKFFRERDTVSGRMYTLPEAAKLMGITRQRLHVLVKQGRVKAHRLGRIWVVTEDAIGNIAPSTTKRGRPRKHKRRK